MIKADIDKIISELPYFIESKWGKAFLTIEKEAVGIKATYYLNKDDRFDTGEVLCVFADTLSQVLILLLSKVKDRSFGVFDRRK